MAISAEIFEKVQETLCEALSVDEDEVTEEATLVGDLGAESIDFLDIVFRLEKAFDIKVERGELFPEDIFTNDLYAQNNRLTAEGLAALRERLPFIDLTEFEKNPVVQEFSSRMTVADMCRFVEFKKS
ncbi:MAG: acyl carrier protein [Planctomycetaceae bacterium]|nr:acyl carrier protein [Planctomycetaceae bacterium]MBQ2822093.1 acyl carrier protein [Thermoguttaceae bacterium]MDO4426288.1 acyl carrier protein [Planctomycetia bacterium]